ncbi:MAG: hypothetical protein PHP06_10145 [Clostridia bacterium]|nr:hypothetical protein [Clostridia bacterium]
MEKKLKILSFSDSLLFFFLLLTILLDVSFKPNNMLFFFLLLAIISQTNKDKQGQPF